MANTVNDVMNVIASPDYGIKNIAGTNQEILAILQGTHNSKNNIHAIVNDVRNLLQELVNTSTVKKTVEVGGNSTKINPKHIQNILDEAREIKKAIIDIGKVLSKQGGQNVAVAKLSDKASERVAEAMAKNIEKQNKGAGLSSIVDAFNKLKDISIKDIFIGQKKIKELMKIFKNAKEDLNIDNKELNNIIKLINISPELVKSLSKIRRKVNNIIKNDTIKKLSDILVGETSILTISTSLQDNKDTFENANKSAKSLKELISSLNKAMRKLVFASLWAKLAKGGVSSISTILDDLLPLSTKLTKNKKNIEQGVKSAKKITALVGNLLATSIFLTITAVIGIPAILGALALKVILDIIIPVVKKLSKNSKHIGKAILSSIGFVAITGIMMISSLMLSSIAKTGVLALMGSLVVLGVTTINIFTFKLLSKAQKPIIQGAILMAIMSLSLIIFGVALGKITNATKGVTFKQVAIISSLTVILGAAVAALGIPAVFPFIALGSIAMLLMSVSLIPFGIALGKITSATKSLKMKHILLITGAMSTLALGISAMALLLIPVTLGAITLGAMSLALLPFVSSLKIISDMKTVPIKKVYQVLSAMKIVGNFFKNNKVSLKAIWNAAKYRLIMPPFASAANTLSKISKIGNIPLKLVYQVLSSIKAVGNFYKWNKLPYKAVWNARKYKWVMRPFMKTVNNLAKLKEMGSLPMKLVYQSLDAIKTVGNFFKNNELDSDTIFNAMGYRLMMSPFGGIIKKLSKLKEMGSLPMKLVYQALNAMKTIGEYYTNNPVSWNTIKESWQYAIMLRPFGSTIKKLSKLKEMGGLPMKLVYQALNAMKTIGEYYTNNPISKKTIKASWRYSSMLWPFGFTIKQLSKLKNMGSLPTKLVNQTLDAIGSIADFYQNRKLGLVDGIFAKISASMITGIVKSFGDAVSVLNKLKELRNIPTDAVDSVLNSINGIVRFYRNIKDTNSDNIEEKSEFTKIVVDKFIAMATSIQDRFANVKEINAKAVASIVYSCRSIINYYTYTKFILSRKKVRYMNEIVRRFVKTTQFIKDINFNTENLSSVMISIRAMKQIMRFLKKNTLNHIQRTRAYKNMSILSRMSFVMSRLSNINSSNISSIGDALSTTLGEVKSIDISQVDAVTNMFNAFNGINKSESIINKFTESVKEFTSTCKELMEAMNYNTDAINNMDMSSSSTDTGDSLFGNLRDDISNFGTNSNASDTNNQNNGIRIANVDEIAKTIAEKINGALSIDVPDTQIQLLINGTGGNEWTITRY